MKFLAITHGSLWGLVSYQALPGTSYGLHTCFCVSGSGLGVGTLIEVRVYKGLGGLGSRV